MKDEQNVNQNVSASVSSVDRPQFYFEKSPLCLYVDVLKRKLI